MRPLDRLLAFALRDLARLVEFSGGLAALGARLGALFLGRGLRSDGLAAAFVRFTALGDRARLVGFRGGLAAVGAGLFALFLGRLLRRGSPAAAFASPNVRGSCTPRISNLQASSSFE